MKFCLQVFIGIFQSVSHLLLLTNSSINFLIYCAVATRFRVYIKRTVMCNNEDITSNPPIGVARLVTAPLVVMAAVPHPEPLPIIPLERYNLWIRKTSKY